MWWRDRVLQDTSPGSSDPVPELFALAVSSHNRSGLSPYQSSRTLGQAYEDAAASVVAGYWLKADPRQALQGAAMLFVGNKRPWRKELQSASCRLPSYPSSTRCKEAGRWLVDPGSLGRSTWPADPWTSSLEERSQNAGRVRPG